jgi:hypothetical protein
MQKAQLIIYMGIENNKSSYGEETVRDDAKRSQIVYNIVKTHSFRQERILRQNAFKIGLSTNIYLI